MSDNFKPKAGSYWIVEYECRITIIRVTPQGDEFFAFGQDAVIWSLSAARPWIKEIKFKDDEGNLYYE